MATDKRPILELTDHAPVGARDRDARPEASSHSGGTTHVAIPDLEITKPSGWDNERLARFVRELLVQLGYDELSGTAKKWWDKFVEENKARPWFIVRVFEEISMRFASLTDFFLTYVYSNCDDFQANLHILDYRRFLEPRLTGEARLRRAQDADALDDCFGIIRELEQQSKNSMGLATSLADMRSTLLNSVFSGRVGDVLLFCHRLSTVAPVVSSKFLLNDLVSAYPYYRGATSAVPAQVRDALESIDRYYPGMLWRVGDETRPGIALEKLEDLLRDVAGLAAGLSQRDSSTGDVGVPVTPGVDRRLLNQTSPPPFEMEVGYVIGATPRLENSGAPGRPPDPVRARADATRVGTCSLCGEVAVVKRLATNALAAVHVCRSCANPPPLAGTHASWPKMRGCCSDCGEMADVKSFARTDGSACQRCDSCLKKLNGTFAPAPRKSYKHPNRVVVPVAGVTDTSAWDVPRLLQLLEATKRKLKWSEAGIDARAWWSALEYEYDDHLQLVVRLGEEIASLGANLGEFYDAYLRADTNNLHSILCYMSFSKLAREQRDRAEEEQFRSQIEAKRDAGKFHPKALEASSGGPAPTEQRTCDFCNDYCSEVSLNFGDKHRVGSTCLFHFTDGGTEPGVKTGRDNYWVSEHEFKMPCSWCGRRMIRVALRVPVGRLCLDCVRRGVNVLACSTPVGGWAHDRFLEALGATPSQRLIGLSHLDEARLNDPDTLPSERERLLASLVQNLTWLLGHPLAPLVREAAAAACKRVEPSSLLSVLAVKGVVDSAVGPEMDALSDVLHALATAAGPTVREAIRQLVSGRTAPWARNLIRWLNRDDDPSIRASVAPDGNAAPSSAAP
jgi:hypothetical protein